MNQRDPLVCHRPNAATNAATDNDIAMIAAAMRRLLLPAAWTYITIRYGKNGIRITATVPPSYLPPACRRHRPARPGRRRLHPHRSARDNVRKPRKPPPPHHVGTHQPRTPYAVLTKHARSMPGCRAASGPRSPPDAPCGPGRLAVAGRGYPSTSDAVRASRGHSGVGASDTSSRLTAESDLNRIKAAPLGLMVGIVTGGLPAGAAPG